MRTPLLTALALAGCVSSAVPPADHAGLWALREFDGDRLPAASRYAATLRLEADGGVSGTDACNSLGPGKLRWLRNGRAANGGFDYNGNGAGIQTVARCLGRNVEIADRFWAAMQTPRAWSVEGRRLTVAFADGSAARLTSLTCRNLTREAPDVVRHAARCLP